MIWFIVGLFTGMLVGAMAIALTSAAKHDEYMEQVFKLTIENERLRHGCNGNGLVIQTSKEQKTTDRDIG